MKLIGLGQRSEQYAASDAEVVGIFAVHQADDGVSQTCALRELSDCHHPELLCATESADFVITVVASRATLKRVSGQLIHDLCESETSFVHDVRTLC